MQSLINPSFFFTNKIGALFTNHQSEEENTCFSQSSYLTLYNKCKVSLIGNSSSQIKYEFLKVKHWA